MRFEGGPELKKALEELGELGSTTTAKNAMKRGLIEAARPMVMAAKAFAPKDDHDLEISIQASTQLSRRQRRAAGRPDKWTAEVFVGPDYRKGAHGVIQEFGTEERFINVRGFAGAVMSRKSVGKVPPHPFMRPAFDSTVNVVLMAFAPKVWEEIAKATKRINRKKARKAAA